MLKTKKKTKYQSIFTEDMNKCYITGSTENVDPHHIFGAANKWLSEKYHFMLPLRRDWHTTANYSIHKDRNFNVRMKMKCQEHWLYVLRRTKEEWISEFGKWYTDDDFV